MKSLFFCVILKIIRIVRQKLILRKISACGSLGKIQLNHPLIPISIVRHPTAKIMLNGTLSFSPQLWQSNPICISLGPNSELVIDGDFEIGQGTLIMLSKNAPLYIGGRRAKADLASPKTPKLWFIKKCTLGKISSVRGMCLLPTVTGMTCAERSSAWKQSLAIMCGLHPTVQF